MKRLQIALLCACAGAVVLGACSDGRNQTSVYLKKPSNDQAGKSSTPGAGDNTPAGGAGGTADGENKIATGRPEAGTGRTAGTGMTGSGSGHGTGPGTTTGTASREKQ